MPSRYSQIFETQPVSQYVPLPLELMGKALASKQQQYDTALDAASKVEDEILKVNAIDKHQPFKNKLISDYTNKVESIANDIVKTGDTSKVRELKSIANQWRNDPIRQELETSYLNYNKYLEDKIEKGEKYAIWHDPSLGFIGETEQKNIQPFRFTGMGERQDHQKEARDMMSGIKASSKEWYDVFDVDPNTQNITKIKKGREGIAANYLLSIANRKTDDFLSTQSGDDFIKQMKYYNPKASDKELKSMATEYLYDAGINQLYTKTTEDKDFKFGPESLSKAGITEKDNLFTSGYEPIQPGIQLDEKLTNTAQSLGLTGFRYKDGVIEPITDAKNIKPVYNINGKEYTLSDIKAGKAGKEYSVKKEASIGFGAAPVSIEEVYGPSGKVKLSGSPISAKEYGKQLGDIAYRLGIEVNKDNIDETKQKVGDAIKKLTTSSASFTKFDESTINKLTQAYSVKLDKDGNILDPGNISFVAVKDANGNLINDDLKSEILKGSRLLGSAKSLSGKTEAGDIEVQGSDNKVYYLNTNLPEFNKSFEQSHNMYKSIGEYVNTGKELKDKNINTYKNLIAQKQAKTISLLNPNSKIDVKELEKNTKILNKEYDPSSNKEYITVLTQDISGSVTPKVLIINHDNESIDIDDLDNVATNLDWKNSRKIMGTFNIK